MKKHSKHYYVRLMSIVMLLVISANALAAGYSFIIDPSGAGLGITLQYLKPSAPFHDYFIPGLILFSVIGIFGCFIAALAILKQRLYPLFVLAQGCILVGWITIQLTLVTTFHALHLITGLFGLTLIVSGWQLRKARM
jgi:hypothetical protein